MNESLQTALRKLRLSGRAQSLDVRLQEAAGHSLNHAEFLELILQNELAIRADRLMGRRVRAADFREPRTLEDSATAILDRLLQHAEVITIICGYSDIHLADGVDGNRERCRGRYTCRNARGNHVGRKLFEIPDEMS